MTGTLVPQAYLWNIIVVRSTSILLLIADGTGKLQTKTPQTSTFLRFNDAGINKIHV